MFLACLNNGETGSKLGRNWVETGSKLGRNSVETRSKLSGSKLGRNSILHEKTHIQINKTIPSFTDSFLTKIKNTIL